MRERCVVNLVGRPSATSAALLSGQGGLPVDPWSWLMPDGVDHAELEILLHRHAVNAELGYRFDPEPRDTPERVAAYVPVAAVTEVVATSDPLLAWDPDQDEIVGNTAAMRALEDSSVTWTGTDDLRVARAPVLEEPVEVTEVVEAIEGSRAWLIRSDGREYISEAALAFVQSHGVVVTPHCLAAGRIRRWVRPWIFSGPMLANLRRQHWVGPLEPSFLAVLPRPA